MTKKIGRNDTCPCGSGKKYKHCCINSIPIFNNPMSTLKKENNSLKFIESHDSNQLLDFFIGLQLLPENHGKNVRIEELLTHCLTSLNNNSRANLNNLKTFLDKEYSYSVYEDIAENLFCESVVFYGNNYTVFAGISSMSIEIFRNLIEILFIQNAALPNDFKNHAYSGISFILTLGQILADKFNIRGNIKGNVKESKEDSNLVYPLSEVETSFSFSNIISICDKLGLDSKILHNFITSSDDPNLKNTDMDSNPLLFYPLFKFNDKIYYTLISNQANTLNEYILRLSKSYKCNADLVKFYHANLWRELMTTCYKMGWLATKIEIPENKDQNYLHEQLYLFDTNRIAYVCYVHDSSTTTDSSTTAPTTMDFDINNRLDQIISTLKNNKDFKDYKFLSLITFDNLGHYMFFGVEKGKENELRLSSSIHKFIQLALTEKWNHLSLWKFSKSYNLFSKTTSTMLSDFVDIYSIYKSKDESFYFNDDARPNILMLVPGEGSFMLKDSKIERNYHGILKGEDNIFNYIPCEKYFPYAPLYKPVHSLSYYTICLECFDFPIWIENLEASDSVMDSKIANFAEAIAFWLYKFQSKINFQLNSSKCKCLEIKLNLDERIFDDQKPEDIINDIGNESYSYSFNKSKLNFHIPFSKVKHFFGSDNFGERDMMKSILSALNLVDNISLNDEDISEILDSAMPLGNAKMILMNDSRNDPLIDNRWLIRPLYISNSEIERILDETPALIEKAFKIPKKINNNAEKRELFNIATLILLDQLNNEIKHFDFKSLLNKLVELHETLIWTRERNKTLIPAKILCLGDKEENLEKIHDDETKLVTASLATRCLIEYLAAQPTHGILQAGLDDIDRLLALMSEIANYGFLSDAIHFKLADPLIRKLDSGRIGISREFFNEKLKPFSEANTIETVDKYIGNFDRRFEIYKTSEINKEIEPQEDEELEIINQAFLMDWGIGYYNIYKFCYACFILCIESESSTITMFETELIDKLVNQFELPLAEVNAGLKVFSLQNRQNYLEAPDGFNNNEVFPWKFNREFSFARRFIINYTNADGLTELTWGFRNAISAQKQLDYLLTEGKLNNGGINIKQLLGTFRERKGKYFRNEVKDWLKKHENLVVVDYEVDISPNGHLAAEKNYGDIDILVLDRESNIIWSLECKDTNKAKNIHEMKNEMDKYLGRDGSDGMIQKHINRNDWLNQNKDIVSKFLELDNDFQVISYMITSEVIPISYIKAEVLPMSIISFPELKREGIRLLYQKQ